MRHDEMGRLKKIQAYSIGLFFLATAFPSLAVEISAVHGSKEELKTIELLRRLEVSHELGKWEFTDKVQIDENSTPHSHPILTLNARHTDPEQPDLLLSTYLHEQIHWYLSTRKREVDAAINELVRLIENAPVGTPEGAANRRSTYLHILVCALEVQAVLSLLDAERLDQVVWFWKNDHYTWVYRKVIEEQLLIERVLDKHGISIN